MAKWQLPGEEPRMSIYLLTRTSDAPSYDIVRSMVVRAMTEQEARQLASEKAMDEGKYMWLEADHSHCEEIDERGDAQVMCVDVVNG